MLFGSVASILLSEIIRSSNLPERRASCISWTGLDWTCKTRTSKTRTGLNLFFCSGFQVLDSRFCQCNLGFRIPIASAIPDSLSCSPDSKNIAFHKRKFLGFQNPDSLTSLFFRETDHDLSTKT